MNDINIPETRSENNLNISNEETPIKKEKGGILGYLKSKKTWWLPVGIVIVIVVELVMIFWGYYKDKVASGNLTEKETGEKYQENQTSETDQKYQTSMSFASYDFKKTAYTPSLPNGSINVSELTNLADFEKALGKSFSEDQKRAISENNFFIIKNTDKFWNDDSEGYTSRNDDWTHLYDEIISGENNAYMRNPEDAVFITSDFLLHVYHRLLEKEFEYIENYKMYPILREMTTVLFEKAAAEYQKQTDVANKDSYERILAYLAVPKSILDSANSELGLSMADQNKDTEENILGELEKIKAKMPTRAYELAMAEIKLILEQKETTPSPIFGKYLSEAKLIDLHDYTQYGPRSHYAKNSVLRSYFRSMMWYGRNYFALNSKELTRDAVNLTLLVKKTEQLRNWESIYNPTAFLVGKSDDLGITEYQLAITEAGSEVVDETLVSRVQSEMKNAQGPKIMSSYFFGDKVFSSTKEDLLNKTKGFRFMGQRFTPDAFIFSSLTQGDELPDPETGQRLPSSTTALLVMSVMGNETANNLSQEWIKKEASESDKVLNKNINGLKSEFNKLTEETWTQNIYWSWLYTLKSLNQEGMDKKGYPNFMKKEDWNKKNLLASLGSWTELKHDTLLYAKQSYAELGGGGGEGEEKPIVKGYVEPNIEFLDRLIALIKMTTDGLTKAGLIDEGITWRNNKLLAEVEFFKTIAIKELQNEIISDDDFEELRISPYRLDSILSNITSDQMKEKDARSALIADVHTDGKKREILYEADGIPNYILVAVKDKNGTRLTRGLVYDYYEFKKPLGERLNDENWQKINYTTDKTGLPQQPDWIKSLYK